MTEEVKEKKYEYFNGKREVLNLSVGQFEVKRDHRKVIKTGTVVDQILITKAVFSSGFKEFNTCLQLPSKVTEDDLKQLFRAILTVKQDA